MAATDYHGSLFDFIRNDLFDAPPFNFTTIALTKTKLRQNQFGGDISGPIWIPHLYNGHDRTFFALSLESVRQVSGTNSLSIVPTLLERAGDFSQSARRQPLLLPQSAHQQPRPPATATGGAGCLYPAPYDKIPTLDPVAQKLLAYYPSPNIPGAAHWH